MAPPLRARAFGLRWQSELALPVLPAADEDDADPTEACVQVVRVGQLADRALFPAAAGRHVQLAADGFRLRDPAGVAVDVFADGRMEVAFAPEAVPELPPGFFGTATGLLLALLGRVPMHGSAVELEGEAVLLCGASGAGKSTGAAALIACGARLLSDDLSVLVLPGGRPHLLPGRTTLRLFPDVAGFLEPAGGWEHAPRPSEGKLAVQPPRTQSSGALSLRAVVLLGEAAPTTPRERLSALTRHLYRPAWMGVLPGREQRMAMLALAAGQVALLPSPRVEARSLEALQEHGLRLRRLLDG